MQIEQKTNSILADLKNLSTSPAMQRDLIRSLRSGEHRVILSLDIYRYECGYLDLNPTDGFPRIWKLRQTLDRNIETLFREGFLSLREKAICQQIADTIITSLKHHRLFLFLHCLTHKQKGGL